MLNVLVLSNKGKSRSPHSHLKLEAHTSQFTTFTRNHNSLQHTTQPHSDTEHLTPDKCIPQWHV